MNKINNLVSQLEEEILDWTVQFSLLSKKLTDAMEILGRIQAKTLQLEGDSLGILTTREELVFKQIGSGASLDQMAKAMGIKRKTVEAMRDNIKRKLRLKDADELRTFAQSKKLA